MAKYPCKYKYCNETYTKKASLLKHYINVHSEKILTTTIEKYKKDLTKVEKRKKVKISGPPKKKNKAAKKFKNPYPRIKSANIRN